ncbi:unnamed protein product [Gadus morhua 'NCC']
MCTGVPCSAFFLIYFAEEGVALSSVCGRATALSNQLLTFSVCDVFIYEHAKLIHKLRFRLCLMCFNVHSGHSNHTLYFYWFRFLLFISLNTFAVKDEWHFNRFFFIFVFKFEQGLGRFPLHICSIMFMDCGKDWIFYLLQT